MRGRHIREHFMPVRLAETLKIFKNFKIHLYKGEFLYADSGNMNWYHLGERSLIISSIAEGTQSQ